MNAPASADTDTGTEAQAAQLRVLSGCHAGAHVPVQGGALSFGSSDACDIILSDIELPNGLTSAHLHIVGNHWRVLSTPADAGGYDQADPDTDQYTDPDANALVPLTPWGHAGSVGGLAITVSTPQAAWPVLANVRATLTPVPVSVPVSVPVPVPAPTRAAPPEAEPPSASEPVADPAATAPTAPSAPSAPAQRNSARTAAIAIGLALLLLLAGVLLRLWLWPINPAVLPATATTAPTLDAAQQQQLLRDIQQALAGVDPSLRLHIEPLPSGRARVSGWVQGIEQLDRVAEALASVRPLPLLSVRTAADLLDDLRAAGSGITSATGTALGFELLGAGRIRVTGTLHTSDEHAQALAQLRQQLPAGVELLDGLRAVQTQGAAVQAWLHQAGFEGVQIRWDAEARQLLIEIDIAPSQRRALESLLVRTGQPLSGVPFTLRVRETARAPADAAAALVHASAAPLPFRIRGVVGGAAPYVVLGDGTKLQPGGQRAGWRLVSIEAERLTFDGPRRLVLQR